VKSVSSLDLSVDENSIHGRILSESLYEAVGPATK